MSRNYTVAFWNSLTGSLHGFTLFRYLRARRGVEFTDDDEFWHDELFPDLDRFDFYSLWSVGEEVHRIDEQLTVADQTHQSVALVLDGTVEVRRGAEVIAALGAGSLLGEMSYVSGQPATSDSFAVGTVRLREWDQARLDALQQLNPTAGRAFNKFIQRDLAAKVG